MSLANTLKATIAKWLTSQTRLNVKRLLTETRRRLGRKPHVVYYFHRADDPYCQLMVQVLPDIASRFAIDLRPKVVEKLPANMYPDPARYEAYSIIDASRLARLYGLGFVEDATVPDRLAVGMANRYLASQQDSPTFFGEAAEVGAALWRRDYDTVRRLCSGADLDESVLTENENLLGALGHYASASLYYGGEFYVGIDRLDHLERRFNELGLGDDEVSYEVHRLWRYGFVELERSIVGKEVEVYFSVRSPYSYVGLCLVSELAAKTGVRIKLKPVLPMLMRGMKVPPAKGSYILMDTAREARLEGVDFGYISDPLGAATWRAMAVGLAILEDEERGEGESGQALRFFKAFSEAAWSLGVDGATDKGLHLVLKNAGLDAVWAHRALSRQDTQLLADQNREEMFRHGSWGVPTFRAAGETFWGQDRMWAVVEALKQ